VDAVFYYVRQDQVVRPVALATRAEVGGCSARPMGTMVDVLRAGAEGGQIRSHAGELGELAVEGLGPAQGGIEELSAF
jgi:hypothetical protein